jgi:hypothetical protein
MKSTVVCLSVTGPLSKPGEAYETAGRVPFSSADPITIRTLVTPEKHRNAYFVSAAFLSANPTRRPSEDPKYAAFVCYKLSFLPIGLCIFQL